jgi:hypothetical protein
VASARRLGGAAWERERAREREREREREKALCFKVLLKYQKPYSSSTVTNVFYICI